MPDIRESRAGENDARSPAWVRQSNRLALPILESLARFEPENFAPLGVPGTAGEVMRLAPDRPAEEISVLEEALRTLAELRHREQHAEIRCDIDAMTCYLGLELDVLRTESALTVPCPNLAQTIVLGLITLLVSHPGKAGATAAVARMRRYAGLEVEELPLAGQAETLIRHRLRRRLLQPWREGLVHDLNAGPKLLAELPRLAAQYRLRGHERAVEALCRQLGAYHDFLRQEVLPQCRDDFRLPPELYAARLRRCGVEMSIDELMHRAEAACVDARRQLIETAHHLARQRGWGEASFPELLRRLARERLEPGQILSHYTRRLKQLETIVAGADFVSRPRCRPVVRLASEAENGAFPFPHFRWPRVFGGRGEAGDIVLPLTSPSDRAADLPGDGYASRAVSWATAVHEGLPGHGLQIGRLLEPDVSLARGPLAFNYAALEGWAVYAETEITPHLPLEARFLARHAQLRRAVAAILDPGLQRGRFTRRQAARLLRDRVGLSAREAEQAVWRYTVWSPGQATSYFYGHIELAALRTAVEHQLGSSFDGRKYHDDLLSQGLLPLSLLRRSLLKAHSSERRAAA